MITSKLMGGLGNQMFQYAVARQLSHFHDTDLLLDISEFDKYPDRNFSLDCFQIKGNVLPVVSGIISSSLSNRLIKLKNIFIKKKIYIEHSFPFDPEVLELENDIALSGYFQSEKYFIGIEEIIRKEFKLKEIRTECTNVMKIIKNKNSVSVHIRRGDYAKNSVTTEYHGLCNPEYYGRSMELIEKKCDKPHYFIFSDDIAWVKKNIRFKSDVTYVSGTYQLKDPEEMIAMSNCQHHILANSSFSWWGAWLNESKNKTVIAPKQWFKNPSINTKDLLPEKWLKI